MAIVTIEISFLDAANIVKHFVIFQITISLAIKKIFFKNLKNSW